MKVKRKISRSFLGKHGHEKMMKIICGRCSEHEAFMSPFISTKSIAENQKICESEAMIKMKWGSATEVYVNDGVCHSVKYFLCPDCSSQHI